MQKYIDTNMCEYKKGFKTILCDSNDRKNFEMCMFSKLHVFTHFQCTLFGLSIVSGLVLEFFIFTKPFTIKRY